MCLYVLCMSTAVASLSLQTLRGGPSTHGSFRAGHAGTKARLRSKHNLLATLVERVRDSSAYTRARVLQTWSHLSEASAIPLGHWVCVTDLAVGTLPSRGRYSYSAAELHQTWQSPGARELGLLHAASIHSLTGPRGTLHTGTPFWISNPSRNPGSGFALHEDDMVCTGRLEDKSSIVRKAALQLLRALLLYNPFGGELPEGRFEASLTEWRAKLQVIRVPLPMVLPDRFSLVL